MGVFELPKCYTKKDKIFKTLENLSLYNIQREKLIIF